MGCGNQSEGRDCGSSMGETRARASSSMHHAADAEIQQNVMSGVRAEKKEGETGIIRQADTAASSGFRLVLQQSPQATTVESKNGDFRGRKVSILCNSMRTSRLQVCHMFGHRYGCYN